MFILNAKRESSDLLASLLAIAANVAVEFWNCGLADVQCDYPVLLLLISELRVVEADKRTPRNLSRILGREHGQKCRRRREKGRNGKENSS